MERLVVAPVIAPGPSSSVRRLALEFLHFGLKNARSCVFPVFIFAMLAVSQVVALPIARYDFLLLACLAFQVFMLASGLESRDELKVITLFHVLGLALELFKVHVGSWSYPEAALFKVVGVPLYSGFRGIHLIVLVSLGLPPWPVRVGAL